MVAALVILFSLLIHQNYSIQQTSFKCPCGVDNNNKDQAVYKIKDELTRIVGGEDVNNTNPWYVFLLLKPRRRFDNFRCGASLLNREWVVTAAHCLCNDKINLNCAREGQQLVPKYNLAVVEMYLGLSTPTIQQSHVDPRFFRGTKTVVIHEGYKPELLDRSYNDIALIKFDRPFFPETVTHAKMMPICLPQSSTFKDEDKQGFAVGFGIEKQQVCRTNGVGPDIHQECARATIYSYKGTTDLYFWKLTFRQFSSTTSHSN